MTKYPTFFGFCTLAGLLFSSAFAQRAEDRPLAPSAPVRIELSFDFGGGADVRALEVYSDVRGSGFDFGSDVERGDGCVMSAAEGSPFFFSVKVPEGNYRVTVTLGDGAGVSDTTLRVEAGRLVAADVATVRGASVTREFCANVRRPQLPPPPVNAPGGSMVHMFLRGEAESRNWDDRLTIEFNGKRPCVRAIRIVKDDALPTVFVAGDSTVADPRGGPGGNWPTQLCQFFKPVLAVCNAASGGETSKSFITGYRFDKVLSQMKAGDFFLIQFGHNDSKPQWPQSYTEPDTSFKAYLRVFIAETRRRGATPVLVTPMERRENKDTVGRWARAMIEVAAAENVAVIDQWSESKKLWAALGPKRVGEAFADQTHLSNYGGYLLAKLMVAGIRKNVPTLASCIVDDFVEMRAEAPEMPPAYLRQSAGGETRLIAGIAERAAQVALLSKIVEPVLSAGAEGALKDKLPKVGNVQDQYAPLEALGRTLAGVAPWLELGPDAGASGGGAEAGEALLRARYIELAVKSIRLATDPESRGFLIFNKGRQPLVDTAFLAQGLLRAPKQFWGNLDEKTRANVVAALKSSRVIEPARNNWELFSAMVEAALLEFTGECEMTRIERAVNDHLEWYKGDGVYGDGPVFHWDYYNSYVIQPMLCEVLEVCARKNLPIGKHLDLVRKRAQRYAEVQERLISPEGSFPIMGRSSTYRVGAFQTLSFVALRGQLPATITRGGVRSGLDAVIKRMMVAPENFDAQGWLKRGAIGAQERLAEPYINRGSIYLCAVGFLHLGLPASDAFWTDADAAWTQKRLWAGEDLVGDHSIKE